MIRFEVLGCPAPKGSARAMMIGGKARVIASGSSVNQRKIKSWDVAVRDAAACVVGTVTAPPFIDTALAVSIVFHMIRPSGHWGAKGVKASAPTRPRSKPDVDKIARATLDSLTGIVFDDDSRICDLALSKRWAQPGQEGASIEISEAV